MFAGEVRADIRGAQKVADSLNAKCRYRTKMMNVTTSVIYDAYYALRIHEDLQMPHPNGGQAKYLEAPARYLRDRMVRSIVNALKAGRTVEQAQQIAAKILFDESQKLVPVDTGFLKASASIETKSVRIPGS